MASSLRHVIGQTMIVGLEGTSLTDDEARFLSEENIGGVILFDRNIESPQQLYDLVKSVHLIRKTAPDRAPLFVSVDMEGGRVQRLKPPFTQWPPMRQIGDLDSASLAFKFAESMGTELKAMGINVNYAPSVDVYTNPKNEIIGDRSFGTDPEIVGKMSSAVVRGFIKSGIIPCAKHFPGHGNTLLDSHEALPEEDKTVEDLEKLELPPFKKAFRARLDLLMTAHIRYPKIDPEWPATLSSKIINGLAREKLGYRNLVISDDLDMKALRNHWEPSEIAVQAVTAGCNILLYCNEPESPRLALDAIEKAVTEGTLDRVKIEENHKQVLRLKQRRLKEPDPLSFDEVSKTVGHPEHLTLSKAIKAGEVPDDLQT